MLKIENVLVEGLEPALRGMRNPKESWEKSDSEWLTTLNVHGEEECFYEVGYNDLTLAKTLSEGGAPHAKYMRMIVVWLDITAMQPWWSEFDTYKVGTVRDSCSKMHKIDAKPFDICSFATGGIEAVPYARNTFIDVLRTCERLRQDFNATKDKKYWRALIELLPEGYEMRSTVMLNYWNLAEMYYWRKNHKLKEWHVFCDWIKTLPYSELITNAGVSGRGE